MLELKAGYGAGIGILLANRRDCARNIATETLCSQPHTNNPERLRYAASLAIKNPARLRRDAICAKRDTRRAERETVGSSEIIFS